MKKLPISAAKNISEKYNLKQCLIIGFDGDQVYVTTYGKTRKDCESAAKAQDFWLGHIKEFSFRGVI